MAEQVPFGVLLRRLREASGLSQEELAERASLSSHAVSALERGTRTRPYPHTVRSLADALEADDGARAALVAAVPTRTRTPGPVTVDAVPGGRSRPLPAPVTALVGRDADRARIREALRRERLVTLTGLGGVGKTRLALAVAHDVAAERPDGVAWVELAAVRDVEAVLPAIADALEATPPPSGGDPVAALVEHLADRELLLVVDNVEHLLGAAGRLADLVAGAPGLSVLATSRAPLRVPGEVELRVPPLDLPTGADPDSSAHRLLLQRARDVTPDWGSHTEDAAVTAEIARRLEGIPLALELVAARCRLLDPASLLDRLDPTLLAGGRGHPERQRTMRATLDWSHDLLTGEEQRLLRLLSVFAGGFRLDDVERVVALFGGAGQADVLPVLEALVEQSLVVNVDVAGTRRHRLLEPVAQYARSRLEEAGEVAAATTAHGRHYLALAEEVAPHYRDGGQVAALARIDLEHDNLTAAAERMLSAGDAAGAGRLAWALWLYWWLRGHHAHGRRLAEAAASCDLPAGVRARAELAAATMCFALDDVAAARRHWSVAAECADDPVAAANAVAGVGLADLAEGDLASARSRFAEALPLAEAGGPDGEWTAALSLIWDGTVSLLQGDPDAATASVERGLASARRRGDRLSAYIALYNLCQIELGRGRHREARRHLEEGMRLSVETGDQANLAYLLDALAVLEAAEGAHARVPILVGGAQGIREAVGSRGYGYYRPDPGAIAAAVAAARRHLGPDRYDDALDHGRSRPVADVVAMATGAAATGPPASG